MLDVHPPEHGIHDVRQFLLHLFTITCGLLIALGLEASVEALHHRHQREEAETKIREEIRGNIEGLHESYPAVVLEMKDVEHLIDIAETVRSTGKMPDGKISLQFHEGEIPEAAWQTASSDQVLEYMPYDEVERFADAYREQALLQSIAEKTLEDYLELTPQVQGPFGKEDARDVLIAARRTLGHLRGIVAAGQGTLQSYEAALK